MTERRRRFSQNSRLMRNVLDALREYDVSEVRLIAERFRAKHAGGGSTRPESANAPSLTAPAKRKRSQTTVKTRAALLAKTRPPVVKTQTAKKAKAQKPPPSPPVVPAAKPKKPKPRPKSSRFLRHPFVAASAQPSA